MSERNNSRRVRVAFEANHFSSEQLIKVYEQLRPVKSRIEVLESYKRDMPQEKKRPNMRGGAR